MSDVQDSGPSGIGGWLILVAIGLIISPIRLVILLCTTLIPLFSSGAWNAFTDRNSELYQPMFAPLMIFEMLGNAFFVVAAICLIVLFFMRSRYFPALYIGLSIMSVLFIVLDAYLCTFVFPEEPMLDADTGKELARSIVSCAIWIPYMLVSKRVKNTFVR